MDLNKDVKYVKSVGPNRVKLLNKLNISKENIDIIITNIAYFNKDDINIALYLELLSKSIGFATSYDLREVIKVVKEIHDVYYPESADILLEEYERLKINLAEQFPEDYESYWKGKKEYIDELEEKAVEWQLNQSKMGSYMAMGMSLGLATGCAVGYVLSEMILGMIIGVPIGLCLGILVGRKKVGK